ncbi:TIGR01620 family protein [Kangiella marina]|uniref:TIGR01620 family protein n=1 Tax=Kangiella marina TaxID=1079178 RepID=A0ABP8IEM2_9GAMM
MSDKPIKFSSSDKAHQSTEELLREDILQSGKDMSPQSGEEKVLTTGSSAELRFKQKNKSILKKLFWPSFSAFIVTAAGYEAYQFVTNLWDRSWLLGLGVGTLGAAAVISGAYALIRGWKARRRFKSRQHHQQEFTSLMAGNTYGQSPDLINTVNSQIAEHVDLSGLTSKYQQQKQQVHNDQELIEIYSSTVLSGLDKMAIDVITKHATEAAAMVALSPLAAADMALVAWRSSKMIEQLSQLYGCPQTALGRFEMTKSVFKNMMLAGASELVADAGVELLGKSLTATISAKAAQGIGVGVLIARMGLQTMRLCRPVPFGKDDKPRLGQIRKSVYQKVVGLLKSVSTGKSELKKDSEDNKK